MFWAIPGVRRGRGRARGRTVATGDDVLRWNFLRTLAALALAANLRDWRDHFCRQTSCHVLSLTTRSIYAASFSRLFGFICYLLCHLSAIAALSNDGATNRSSAQHPSPATVHLARPMNLYCNIQTNSSRSLLTPRTRKKLSRPAAYINAKLPVL